MRTDLSNGMLSLKRRTGSGFTLLELVIAVAIFSLISVMAYSGLYSAQLTSARVEEAGDRLSALQVAFSLLARDLQQSVNRPVRDAFGENQIAFMGARTGVGAMLEFTRTGLRNPAGFARSSLQRVAYAVEEDTLLRLTWPSLDRGYGAEPVSTPILSGVKQVELRFMDIDRNWLDQWPPVTMQAAPDSLLPLAVEITVETEDLGKLVRLFRIPGDAPTLATMMQGITGAAGKDTAGDGQEKEGERTGQEDSGEDVQETDPEANTPVDEIPLGDEPGHDGGDTTGDEPPPDDGGDAGNSPPTGEGVTE